MVVNRRPTDGVTYGDFICIHGGGSLDCDVNFNLVLDSDWLDPNFWTEGWEPGVNPQRLSGEGDADSGRMHLELIMFARNAELLAAGQLRRSGPVARLAGNGRRQRPH